MTTGPGDEGDNPFAAPAETRPRGRFILMPGWILLMFGAIAAMVPFTVGSRNVDAWVVAIMYGAPGGIAVLILAPNNLRFAHHRGQSLAALILVGVGIVVSVVRIVAAV